MNRNMLITKDGLELLERVVRSCPPEPSNGGMAGKMQLMELSRKGREIDFGGFLERLGLKNSSYNVFRHIKEIAEGLGVETINAFFIAWYFGGSPHIKRALEFTEDQVFPRALGENYADLSFFSHILLWGTVYEILPDSVNVLYRNQDVSIIMKSLVPFYGEMGKIKVGAEVLCHHSSIVKVGVTEEARKMLLREQASNKEFVRASLAIPGEINHKRMLSYAWAKRASKQFMQ